MWSSDIAERAGGQCRPGSASAVSMQPSEITSSCKEAERSRRSAGSRRESRQIEGEGETDWQADGALWTASGEGGNRSRWSPLPLVVPPPECVPVVGGADFEAPPGCGRTQWPSLLDCAAHRIGGQVGRDLPPLTKTQPVVQRVGRPADTAVPRACLPHTWQAPGPVLYGADKLAGRRHAVREAGNRLHAAAHAECRIGFPGVPPE